MSTIKWSDEQLNVIGSIDNNTLVSASAGSGKTAVMIERVIRLVIDYKIPLDKILMVTFTEAVAKELKLKISNALKKAVQDPNVDYEFVRSQIEMLPMCQISTLHSMCGDLIRKNFNEISVDPSFGVLEESSASLLLSNALSESLEFFEKDTLVEDLKRFFGSKRSFLEELKNIHTFIVSQPNREQYFSTTIFSIVKDDFDNLPFIKEYLMGAKQRISRDIDTLQEYAFSFEQNGFVDNRHYQAIKQYIDYASKILTLTSIKEIMDFCSSNSYVPINLSGSTKKEIKDYWNEIKEDFNSARDYLKGFWAIFDNDYNVFAQQLVQQQQYLSIIAKIIQLAIQKYAQSKTKENKLDFNDLEHFANQLLQDESVAKQISDDYAYICVDEYQDINPIQESIISRLSLSGNLFMVGDIKQSIYQFRHTDPTIFLDKSHTYSQNSDQGVNWTLNMNYRSSKDIVDFVNSVFDHIMTKDFGGIDYKSTSRLGLGLDKLSTTVNPSVEICYFEKTKQESNLVLGADGIYSVQEHSKQLADNVISNNTTDFNDESLYILSKINELVGVQDICELVDNEPVLRKIRYSDIMLLCSSRSGSVPNIVECLKQHNVPIDTSNVAKKEQDSYINNLIDFVRIVVNHKQDYALIGAMCGYFGGFDYDEVAYIRSLARDNKYFYQAFEYARDNTNDLQNKIQEFCNKIEHYALMSSYVSVCDLLKTIVIDYRYNNFILSKDNGVSKLALLNNFINDIDGKTYNNSLVLFLNIVEEMPDIQEAESVNFSQGDCVGITTIHASKGLQYPIVFLVDSAKRYNDSESKDKLLIDKQFGAIMRSFDTVSQTYSNNIAFDLLRLYRKEQMLFEKTRLLYVALTRAKNMLFVTATAKRSNKDSINSCSSFFDCLCYVADKDEDFGNKYFRDIVIDFDNNDLPHIVGDNTFGADSDIDTLAVSDVICSEQEQDNMSKILQEFVQESCDFNKIQSDTFKFRKPNKQIVDAIKDKFNNNYSYANAINIGIKHTVTAINYDNTKNLALEYGTSNILFPDNIDKSLVGTAYHKVLESIDFECKDKTDVQDELIKMVEKRKLTKEQYDCINVDHIWECISSPLIQYVTKNKHYREKEFMLYLPANLILDTELTEKVLLQGVIDLFVVGEQNIIVDFKFSSMSDEYLVQKYSKQMQMYKVAVESCLNVKVDKMCIYVVGTNKVLDI